MAVDLTTLIADGIGTIVQESQDLDEKQLLSRISNWLDEASQADRFAATPSERFKNWVETTLLPSLRRLGQNGQKTWDTICDPTSTVSKERIASVVLTLSVMAGMQTLDVSTLVAIVILAIRSKSSQS